MPKDAGSVDEPGSKGENGHLSTTSHGVLRDTTKEPNLSSLSTFATNKPKLAKPLKPKAKQKKSNTPDAVSCTKSLYQAASNAASALLSTHESSALSIEESNDSTDTVKAAKAAAKAERKQIKKAEKERRKLEKKKRKILEKQQRQMKEVSTVKLRGFSN